MRKALVSWCIATHGCKYFENKGLLVDKHECFKCLRDVVNVWLDSLLSEGVGYQQNFQLYIQDTFVWILSWELGDTLVILYSMGMGCSSHLFHG